MYVRKASTDGESDLQRKLEGLRLASPLLEAAMRRPGISPSQQSAMVDAIAQLLARTWDMVRRITPAIQAPPFNASADGATIAAITQEVAHLVAEHWVTGSEASPEQISELVVATLKGADRLSIGAPAAGDEGQDQHGHRLASSVTAVTRIALGMSTVNTLGLDRIQLCKDIATHMGAQVQTACDRLNSHHPRVIDALMGQLANLYIQQWYAEVDEIREVLQGLDRGDRETYALQRQADTLPQVFEKIEIARDMMVDLAQDLEALVRPERYSAAPLIRGEGS